MDKQPLINKNALFFWIITSLVVCIHLSNIWRLRTYPFTDLPNHLAEAYLLQTLTLNPGDPLGDYYRIDLKPYTPATLHAVFCAVFPDIEIGNKVFYTISMLLIVVGLAMLIQSGRGDPWLAILGALFFYHFSVKWGFAGYTAGVALAILTMLLLVRFLDHPRLWSALLLALSIMSLYYAHTIAWLFVIVCALLLTVTYKGFAFKHRLLVLGSLLPGLILFVLWKYSAQEVGRFKPTIPFLFSYYRIEYLPSLRARILELFLLDNHYLFAGRQGKFLALGFTLPLALGLLALAFRKRSTLLRFVDSPARFCGVIFLFVSGICYLVLPNRLPAQHFIFERFSVFVFLGIIWVGSFLVPTRHSLVLRAIIALMVLVHAILWFQYFQDFNHTAQPIRALLYHNPNAQNQSLAAIMNTRDFRGHPSFTHYQNYQIIWNHGAAVTVIVTARFPIIRTSSEGILPFYYENVGVEDKFNRVLIQYRNIDLLIGDSQDTLKKIKRFGGYKLIDRVDNWFLIEKTPRK